LDGVNQQEGQNKGQDGVMNYRSDQAGRKEQAQNQTNAGYPPGEGAPIGGIRGGLDRMGWLLTHAGNSSFEIVGFY
jgi:hypothetical protein